MFGFDLLPLSAFLVLASASGDAAQMCGQKTPTRINVVPRTSDVTYDYSQTLKDIQNSAADTVDPYAFHGTTVTQGYMKGKIEPKYKLTYRKTDYPSRKATCLAYDEINVELNIEPKIIIARELARDSCLRKSIVAHELKHVRVDREVVNKYAKQIGQKLITELKSRGFSAGPFTTDRTDEVQAKMDQVVAQILDLEFQKMVIERQENQRAVDNLEEYESVNAQCPEFEKNKEKLYTEWLK